MTVRTSLIAALMGTALIFTTPFAEAAGVTKTLKFSIANSSLGGYVATPVPGYSQQTLWGLATATNSFALTYDTGSTDPNYTGGPPTVLGDPAYITIVGPTGAILSKEPLPAAMRIPLTDCTYPTSTGNNGCPTYFVINATPLSQIPNKLWVFINWTTYNVATNSYPQKAVWFILDTTAALNSQNRWTLIYSGPNGGFTSYNVIATPPVFPTLYVFDSQTTPGTTYAYTVK